MVKRKWYVVVVGRDIGVFPSWLEAGELVKGVPNALHQSFNTREEALRKFQEAQARGATRIVDPDAPPNGPRRPSSNSPRTFTQSTPSRAPVHAPVPTLQTRVNRSYPSSDRFHRTKSSQTSHSSSFSWSSSEPSPRLSRLQEIQSVFDRLEASGPVGVKARAPSVTTSTRGIETSTRTSTPTTSVSGRRLQKASTASPEMFRGSRSPTTDVAARTPRVIVGTPSWIPPYPNTSPGSSEGSLSPLSVNLKLHSLSGDRHGNDISHSPSVPRQSASNETRSPSCSPSKTPYRATTTSDVRAGQRTRRIVHETDPRSPIINQSQVPELGYENFSFVRPSPQVKREPLPRSPSSSHGSSLLFKHGLPLSPMKR